MFMMKPTYLVIASLALFAVCSPAAEPESTATKDDIRAAIATFRQDPLSPQGEAAGARVRAFAEKNTSVLVEISDKVTPFLNNPNLVTAKRTLLRNAFIAGNIDSQLAKNEKKNDSYGGVLEVIHVYREMQKRDPAFTLPAIENFIQMEKKGELKAYANSP